MSGKAYKSSDDVYYEFYTAEGLLEEPKRYFVLVCDLIEAAGLAADRDMIDIGCANGSFLHYAAHRFPTNRLTGTDIFDDMLDQARGFLPSANFRNASALDMPSDMTDGFDVVVSLGVMLAFDDRDMPTFIDNVIGTVRPGGTAFILSVFSDNGTDLVTRWRHRADGSPSDWVADRNVYAFETVDETLAGKCKSHRFVPFDLGMERAKTDDPRRAWTMKTETNAHQLVTGPNLLVNQYVLEIEV